MSSLKTGLLLLICVFQVSAAAGPLMEPFAVKNHNPFMGVYDVPGMSPAPPPSGASRFDIALDIFSHFTSARTAGESLRIDGETYRATFRYTRAINDAWHGGIEIPVIAHDGGFLDGTINTWHDFWGLPDLGRPDAENNQLRFIYQRNGADVVNVSEKTSGLGDVVVFAGRRITNGAHASLRLKLPTGDTDTLHGSGGADVSAALRTHRQWPNHWSGGARLGLAYLGPGDVLPGLQRHWAVFGGAVIGWRPHAAIVFKGQIDAHTPLYENSDIEQLTGYSIQAALGASLRLNRRTYLDFAVVEDELNPDVSPDVGFHIRVRRVSARSPAP